MVDDGEAIEEVKFSLKSLVNLQSLVISQEVSQSY